MHTLRIFRLEPVDGAPACREFAAVEEGGYIVATGLTPREARERSLNVFANLETCRKCGTRDQVWNQRDQCLACGELLV